MAPNAKDPQESVGEAVPTAEGKTPVWKVLVWRNIILLTYLHVMFVYSIYVFFFLCSWKCFFLATVLGNLGGIGVTGGAHRLWTHRAFKATWQLKTILLILNTMAMQTPLIEWARDHRVHHKFSETDADPHNARRGFFFSHMGWLLVRKHPEVIRRGRTVDISDLLDDPFVMFQKKYYPFLAIALGVFMPWFLIWYLCGDSLWISFHIGVICRYVLLLHYTWFVNSLAHLCGNRPYDRNINPRENWFVSIVALGEGWHNYHHTFPNDYKTAELGGGCLNITALFIELMAKIGWAYDLKQANPEVIKRQSLRYGDTTSSRPLQKSSSVEMTPMLIRYSTVS